MKINVLGGGPSGLFFAILMKRISARHQVTVFERNPPDATFGWGVVFSEETLGALRDADLETFLKITESFATWDTIEIHYQGRIIRSRGHSFSAISRASLLNILQRRAAELGVELHFESEIDDPAGLADAADLLVGADGVNSTVRPWRADRFGPSVSPYASRFVWFGTDLVFDAFTFIFRETEHGMFQAHAYPFDAGTSTFIVECNEATWQRAGLEQLSEQDNIAFCQDLFARELGSHRLLSNRSIWLSFLSVGNKSWHDGNVVLLGDAAHTAHFSIGSGTKLAMEDSVALANAFVRHPRALEKALTEYEMERQPVVERFQQSARDSARYFENVAGYAGMQPLQFTFNLLTRSVRITYTNLTLRDPNFVRELDSWFETAARPQQNGRRAFAPPPMFAPLQLEALSLGNRVVEAPIGEDSEPDGRPGDGDAERLFEAGRSGAGLVLTGLVAVSLEGRVTSRSPTLHTDEHTAVWAKISERVHDAGARIALQLGHAGRRGSTRPREHGVDMPLRAGGWPLLSASAIPYTKASAVPAEASIEDMERVREAFASAAARAAAAGVDVLELQLAEGYLLHSFISPLANRRADDYGGELDNRLRFPLSVVEAVRERWPEERVLSACLSATDWARGGTSLAEAVETARRLRTAGCALIHVSAGHAVAETRADYRRSFLTQFSDRIRTGAGVATLIGGYLTTPDELNTVIGAGRADLCILDPATVGVRTGLDDDDPGSGRQS